MQPFINVYKTQFLSVYIYIYVYINIIIFRTTRKRILVSVDAFQKSKVNNQLYYLTEYEYLELNIFQFILNNC